MFLVKVLIIQVTAWCYITELLARNKGGAWVIMTHSRTNNGCVDSDHSHSYFDWDPIEQFITIYILSDLTN